MTRRLPTDVVQAIKRVEKGRRLLSRIKHRLYRLYTRPNRYQEALELFFMDGEMEEWLRKSLLLMDKYCAAWPVSTVRVPLEKLDRRKGMLAGPLFTSASFPWPTLMGKKQQPVCQVDLRDATRISGWPFGDGLLQVWGSYGDSLIRVIPRAEVESDLLTPLLPLDHYRDIDPWPIEITWIKGEPVTQIVGYEQPFFDAKEIESLSHPMQFIPVSQQDRAILTELVVFLSSLETGYGSHLFGCTDGVQYSAADKPNCFVELDGIEFGWSFIGGTGHVFYEFDQEGTPHFYFDWSCG